MLLCCNHFVTVSSFLKPIPTNYSQFEEKEKALEDKE